MSHARSTFCNSCLKVPVDPINKMPSACYERSTLNKNDSVRSSTPPTPDDDKNVMKVKDFYESIPDYKDINHLPSPEFYSTLKSLRERKQKLLGFAVDLVDEIEEGQYRSKCKIEIDVGTNQSFENLSPKKNSNIKTEENSHTQLCEKVKFSEVDDEIDEQFRKYFMESSKGLELDGKKAFSLPSSPLKSKYSITESPLGKKRLTTIIKPFKMTIRDEDNTKFKELRKWTKSFSDEYLNKKIERKQFRANPVPIESRIPLYDKICEDQALRSAITKLNSAAELQAKMKPFRFTKRDENNPTVTCDRIVSQSQYNFGKGSNKKLFKARPIPKNLFSNYIYERMKEDDFFRAMKRRIRAEELLKQSSLPPSMAARNKSAQGRYQSTPAGITSELPLDFNSDISSNKSRKQMKPRKCCNNAFREAGRVSENTNVISAGSLTPHTNRRKDIKEIYSPTKKQKMTSVFEPRSLNKSNLAAVLRIESTKKKIVDEIRRMKAERDVKEELKFRDRVLRRKPAWDLVKNNHEKDIAMRLQTRRDEERLLKEQFLHEMELMYDRVSRQPLLFERHYPVRKTKSLCKSSLKVRGSADNLGGTYVFNSPVRGRKVSINETPDPINERLVDFINDSDDESVVGEINRESDLENKEIK